MKYPKLDPIKWANAKLTVKERGEVDYYINHAGWSLKRVAEMYHVSVHTAMYWSDPEFKRIDNIRAGERMARKMLNPAYRKKIIDVRKGRISKRMEEEPMFRAWVKTGWKENYQSRYDNRTDEDIEKGKVCSSRYYRGHKEEANVRTKRFYRSKDFTAFRMFQKHINSVFNADNICHSKKETRSTSSYKRKDVSITKLDLVMEKKSLSFLQRILRIILRPIHALRRESSTTHK